MQSYQVTDNSDRQMSTDTENIKLFVIVTMINWLMNNIIIIHVNES